MSHWGNGTKTCRLYRHVSDLILLDMKMPEMNGIETLRQIRNLDSQVTVIMMTGYGDDPQVIEQSRSLGILCYIAKPFDLFDLRERVREILNSSGIITMVEDKPEN